MSDCKTLKLCDMTEKQKQVYKAFREFYQQYIDNGGKPAELSDTVRSIMDKTTHPNHLKW